MRKSIIGEKSGAAREVGSWLDLATLAEAELTSEDPAHPLEAALQGVRGGWRAATAGEQTIHLRFDQPLRLSGVLLVFREENAFRSQEFLLRWAGEDGSYHDIVRQQFNFSPPNTVLEREEYTLDLSGVRALELKIDPDRSGGGARASLEEFRVAGFTVKL